MVPPSRQVPTEFARFALVSVAFRETAHETGRSEIPQLTGHPFPMELYSKMRGGSEGGGPTSSRPPPAFGGQGSRKAGGSLRGRQSGADLKPPQAAVVKSDGGERCGKVGTRFRQARLREASASEPLQKCRNAIRRCQNRGLTHLPG